MAEDSRVSLQATMVATMQSVAAVELFDAQVEAARYLEATYLSVADFPEIAKKVRMTAHAARTQHMMSNSLMKSFKISSSHIIDTLIPMILDAVDLQERSIVDGAFDKIMSIARKMSQEAINTQQRYREIQTQVQDSIGDIKTKNNEVKERKVQNELEREEETALVVQNRRAVEQLKAETESAEKDLDTIKKNRDTFFQQNVEASEELARNTTFLDKAIVPSEPITGPRSAANVILGTGVNLLRCFTGHSKRKEQFDRTHERYKEEQDKYEETTRELREQRANIHKKNQERLEKWTRLKKLCMESVSLGDATSLANAMAKLGDVDRQLTRLIEFWNNLVLVLEHLRNDTEAGEVYLKKIEDERFATRFKGSISRAEEKWKLFDLLCQNYVQACEDTSTSTGINNLYKFLSDAIDNYSAEDRLARMHTMFNMIQAEARDQLAIEDGGS